MASNAVDRASPSETSQPNQENQQQPQNQSQENINQLTQLFSKYDNFDDVDNDLQVLPPSGNGEDVDFPFLFWDYMDDGTGERSTPPQSLTIADSNKTQSAAPNNTTQSAAQNTSQSATTQQQPQQAQAQTQAQTQQPQQAQVKQASTYPTPNVGAIPQTDLNVSAQNFVNEIANQIAAGANAFPPLNLGGFPFAFPNPNQQGLVSSSAQTGNFQQTSMIGAPSTGWNPRNGQQSSGNGSMPQPPQQFVNSVSILPKGANGGGSEPAPAPANGLNGNVQQQAQQQQQQTQQAQQRSQQQAQPQQQQQQPQQPLNQFLGALNPQISPMLNSIAYPQLQNPQQQMRMMNENDGQQDQVQNMQIMQQIQKQQQQPQSMVYGQGNLMLPPQQQYQMRMASNQQQTAQAQTPLAQNTNQQLYQSQIIPRPQGGAQPMVSQGGVKQETETKSVNPSQTASLSSQPPKPQSSKKRQLNTETSYYSSVPPSKTNIVSSSDTDCEHISLNTVAKRYKGTSVSAVTKNLSSVPDSSDVSGVELKGDSKEKTGASAEKRIKAEDLLTEEERAQANRRRNREHARNTRARKKAYLESLKTTLDELCRERDTLVNERAGAASMLLEMQKTRTDVLLSFFALRSTFQKKRVLWSSILDETITCVMPVTPYRSFPASEVQISKCQRNVMGIDAMISDAASLHVLLNSLVDRSKFPNGVVQFRYTLIAEEAVVSGSQMMARWSMTTLNAVSLGAKREIGKTGMLCARFNSSHKIVALELMFDVMAFMLHLKQSSDAKAFTMVPNTVQTCVGPFGNTPMVMTLAERPYTITQVNSAWEEMTGWKSEDVVGKLSCKILQGERTKKDAVESLMNSVRYQRPVLSAFTNYDRRGRMFQNFINIYPLSTDSKITHYVGLTVHHERIEPNESTQGESKSKKESKETPVDTKVQETATE